MGLFLFLMFTAVCSVVLLGFAPIFIRFLGELVGSWLRRSSRTRRELLYARVATEQKSYEPEASSPESKEKDDWEEIDSAAVGSAVNGGKAGQDFAGIVGFFHPFW